VVFTAAGDALPYATQGLLRLGTAAFIGGRRVQGRQFIPGLTETANAGTPAQPTTSVMTSMQNAANLLGTTVVTPINQRVWHRPKLGTGGLSTPVITRSISPTWAVLKSRRT
jgi:hypothetical protein